MSQCFPLFPVDSIDLFRAGSPGLNTSSTFEKGSHSSSSSSPFNWGIKIKCLAPDCAFSVESTRILFFIEPTNDSAVALLKQVSESGSQGFQHDSMQLVASFDGAEVPARLLSPDIVEVICPPKQPGINSVWLCSKSYSPGDSPYLNEGNGYSSPTLPNSPTRAGAIPVSSPVQFFFMPSDEDGHMSLAYQLSPQLRTLDVMQRFRHTCRSLDLSYNAIEDLQFLSNFYQLKSLVR
jgi:hypothetical protein